ncbi:DUF2911 domain-containing protein [Roseivirga sp.]|uniref:DUF2911 domain-containing protein n=1 Tax=Roseivirga sp. TaxID=1964215 RepID=UPI003B8BFF96
MKKTFLTLASLLMFLIAGNTALAQRGPAASPKATIKQMIGNTTMNLVYSRPSLDGRDANDMVNKLNKGGTWRTGADTNTLIGFDKDVTIGGKALAAGSYSLWTIPGKTEWTIVISGHTDKWGTSYDDSKDVLKFTAKATKSKSVVETFRIDLTDFDKNSKDKANLELAWGDISVKFPIEVKN